MPILITGKTDDNVKQALVIDVSNLPSGTIIQLDNVDFAVIIGAARLTGGSGKNYVIGDDQQQFIVLGEDDDILSGGGGDDIIGSLGGDDEVSGDEGNDVVFGGTGDDLLSGGAGDDQINGGIGFDIATLEGLLSDYQIDVSGDSITFTNGSNEIDTLTDIERVQFSDGSTLAVVYSDAEAAVQYLVTTVLERDLTAEESRVVQDWIALTGATVDDVLNIFYTLPQTDGLSQMSMNELLDGLASDPYIVELDASRNLTGSDGDNDLGYVPLGLALNVDGDAGHDVLRMTGARDDVHLESVADRLELTRLNDGAMLALENVEMIAFDNGETVAIAHDSTEAVLARLFHSFFDRDASLTEWQAGRWALDHRIDVALIFDWFQLNSGLDVLTDSSYVQTIYVHTLGRSATADELSSQLARLDSGAVSRDCLTVEISDSDEAIAFLSGSVMLQSEWV